MNNPFNVISCNKDDEVIDETYQPIISELIEFIETLS
jgi:hypothetical protein